MGSTHDYRIVESTTPPDRGLTFEFRDEQYTVVKLTTLSTILRNLYIPPPHALESILIGGLASVRRWSSNPKVLSSIPISNFFLFLFFLLTAPHFLNMGARSTTLPGSACSDTVHTSPLLLLMTLSECSTQRVC